MKASETSLTDFLSQNKTQFVIPVYQRNYDWTESQCNQLLEDIIEVGMSTNLNAHFIGSIVFIAEGVYTSSTVKELVIIDGQQRLTTITLLFILLHKLAKQQNNEALAAEIEETYLINKFVSEDQGKLKLKPTDNLSKAYSYILNNDETNNFEHYSRLIDNFNYFSKRVTNENFEVVYKGLTKLMFVEISLDRTKDDPQRIFESLNSTGLDLAQADLIRNFILMGLEPKEQKKVFENYWETIEKNCKDLKSNKDRVSEFIRDFLTAENKKIPNKLKVYDAFKALYYPITENFYNDHLDKIKTHSFYYNKLINPSKEKQPEIKKELEYILQLEINVSYPFLMNVYDDYENGVIDKEIFIAVLQLVQAFVFRRFIVALPTNALNKIFMRLYEDVDKQNYYDSIAKSLLRKKGTQKFPSDSDITNIFEERDFYHIQPKNRSYLFEKLENFNNKETLDTSKQEITIEHIFPQNPSPTWRKELDKEEYQEIRDYYINTIGNLTLSGNNGALGNKGFLEKKEMNKKGLEQGYEFSRSWLNRDLKKLDNWDLKELKKRTRRIRKRCLEIWPYPEVDTSDIDYDEVSIFEADSPTNRKLDYIIYKDERIDSPSISEVYEMVVLDFFILDSSMFFNSEIINKVAISKNADDLRTAKELAKGYYFETNFSSAAKFERIRLILTVFEKEDELYLKYLQE